MSMTDWDTHDASPDLEVAVIGMAGRFPGAGNLDEFWQNLREGVESIRFFSDEELAEAGVAPALLNDPQYVKARGVLDGADQFDAPFFGLSAKEAEWLDPQQRLFLECAWQALEDAGYDAETYPGLIGVFGGVGMNTYLLSHLAAQRDGDPADLYQLAIGNDKDFVTTRVSYKLNLRGPSIDVQTACSTSLVAVHLACQNLLGYSCDMALAGGVSVTFPQRRGYRYQEGMILSPDGHCRAFDAQAGGTVSGDGAGIVVLKRLADAIADGDHIYAVIKGSAVNNDGARRVGYTAPGVEGQAQVIAMAQSIAGVEPETIGYLEAHGTGTPLGDPIEVAALTQVFREKTTVRGFCALGSLKTNVGHLDAAAGVAGLIKTVLALEHGQIPPSLHFERPNPKIEWEHSPFYVNTSLVDWKRGNTPRRAGISSFGIGGTNAHVVLEEAPAVEPSSGSRPWQLLVLSARSEAALASATSDLAACLKRRPELDLADVAYTLQVGRKAFDHRRVVVCRSLDDARSALENADPRRLLSASVGEGSGPRRPAFLFSGQGAQHVNMGRELYDTEPTFREVVDFCAASLRPHLECDLRDVLYPRPEEVEEASRRLDRTGLAQAALFVVEYALARLWMEWGIVPEAMIGHSIGEYVAAALAEVVPLDDALRIVAARGRLMEAMAPGAMLSVPLGEKDTRSLLGTELALAAVNGPASCVVSGTQEAIERLQQRLTAGGLPSRRLHTSHAFHSPMMAPALGPFTEQWKGVRLQAPKIPYVSNVTGTWITAAEATDPGYYARHLRETVRWGDGVRQLLADPNRVLLEVGPGQTLCSLARQQAESDRVIVSSLPHPKEPNPEGAHLLTALSRLWLAGVKVDWPGFYAHQRRRRVPLPTYPFQRARYWLETQSPDTQRHTPSGPGPKKTSIDDWFYVPSWKRTDRPIAARPERNEGKEINWLLLVDQFGLGARLAERCRRNGGNVVTVGCGQRFAKIGDDAYVVDPRDARGYETLWRELSRSGRTPQRIIHGWSVAPNDKLASSPAVADTPQATGFHSLLFLTQAIARQETTGRLQLAVVSSNVYEVTGDEVLCPEKATLLGLCKVIPQEHPNIACRSVDLHLPTSDALGDALVEQLEAELSGAEDPVVAYRGGHRWTQLHEPVRLEGPSEPPRRLRPGGVYLITGGLGRMGLCLAEYLAQAVQARLVLVGRSAFPPREQWQAWLDAHPDDDEVSRKIRRLEAIEALGAELQVHCADVADPRQMQDVIAATYDRFGALHGLIHAAGEVGGETIRAVCEMGPAEVEAQFRAKVVGTSVLAKLLDGKPLDFCLLQSSLSTVLGGLGLAAYAAANHYLDAFASKQNQQNQAGGVPWISVNWDGWQFDEAPERIAGGRPDLQEGMITPDEGREAFRRILSPHGFAQVVVSPRDLPAEIDRWIDLRPAQEGSVSPAPSSPARHARPNIPTAYVAPRNELEEGVAAIWEKLLGFTPVGIHDNFFDLGGNSLLGTQLAAQLRSAYRVDVPLRALFEEPTVAGVARVIAAESDKKAEDEAAKLAELLKRVEQLSEEEAEALLAEHKVPAQ